MDPLDVIKSTVAVVQAISSTYEAIQHLRGLPNEFNEVNQNLPLVQDTLRQAHEQLQDQALDELSKKGLQPVLNGCEKKVKMLLEIFEEVKGVENSEDGSVPDIYRTSLLRLGKAHRVETLMQGILKDLNALSTNRMFKTATQSQIDKLEEAIDQLANARSSPLSSDILQILHTSPYLSRKNRNPDRVPGTCEWFLNNARFQEWRESKSSCMLWVSANPGCGKSVLAKYLVGELETTRLRTTCYFFFKDDFKDQRSARSALSCILHQLFTQRDDLFSNNIVRRLKAYKTPPVNSYYELWELWDILIMASQDNNAGEIVCILDAFDECEDQERQDLANALCKLYGEEKDTKKNANLKFLITSRPYEQIKRGFQPLNIPGLPVIHLRGDGEAEISKISQEIDIYIEERVSRIRRNMHLEATEEQLLLQGLRAVPNQTYLWVYLTLEWIEAEIGNKINETHIREVTSSLPRTVDEAYEKILSKSKDLEEAKKLLHIIVAAAWPLTLPEIDLALNLRQNHESYKDLSRRPDERVGKYVRDLCGLFVNITDSKVYLLHQTAKEFLVPNDAIRSSGHVHSGLKWKDTLLSRESHRILAEICIWHLLLAEFETHPLDATSSISEYVSEHTFLDYSARNWATHFRASDIEESLFVEPLQRICYATSPRCLTWFRVYWASTQTAFPNGFTTLMVASYFGLEQIVKLQFESAKIEMNATDATYHRSALSWASENGFDNIVRQLMKGPKPRFRDIVKLSFSKGATVDTRDIDGRTPLSYAAWNGHLAVVRSLVKKGAQANLNDNIGGTPISYALCMGQQHIVNELFGRAQAGSVDEIRRGLLLSAAKEGHEPIVKRLLENDATTEAVDSEGRTPLSWAATNEHQGIFQLLLDKGADIEAKDNEGRTPLSWAATNEHQGIFQLLLDKGADIEAKDNEGQTPLLTAARYERQDITQLLLDKGADIEAKDNGGRTPLLWAAANKYQGITQLLLDKGANIEAKNNAGWAPLLIAIGNKRKDIIQLLLDKGADIEAKNSKGWTPLLTAVRYECSDIIQLLLDKGADIEAKDNEGRTPLLWATANKYQGITQLLLNKGANMKAKDNRSQMPLLTATRYKR